jgi:hypothetical protein
MRELRQAFENRDLDGLMALMTEDVVFRSPVVFTPYQGRETVKVLMASVGEVLQDWQCERQLGAPGAADQALVFRGRVGAREVEGCDFVHVNDDGLIDEFYVMVRPMSALMALAEAMSRQLGVDASAQPSEQGAA